MSEVSGLVQTRPLKPLLKWAGGKRWFASGFSDYFPTEFERYVEPFFGAGAVFFHLRPKSALVGDANRELVATYKTLKTHWRAVVGRLQVHHDRHSENYYYRVRAAAPKGKIEAAARFIYLNRTCWNGLYRVNLRGQFNVPIGTKNSVLFPNDDFESVSKALRAASLFDRDFEFLVDKAGDGDFVFLDPPYTVRHNLNGFVKYNEKIFSWDDQVRLFYAARRAARRGAQILMTNACHESIKDLYGRYFELDVVARASPISSKASTRCRYEEYVIYN